MPSMAAIFAIGSDKPIPQLPESCSKLAREFVASCLQRCVSYLNRSPHSSIIAYFVMATLLFYFVMVRGNLLVYDH